MDNSMYALVLPKYDLQYVSCVRNLESVMVLDYGNSITHAWNFGPGSKDKHDMMRFADSR